MLTKSEKSFSILFFIIVITELICGSYENLTLFHYFTKPAIVISLIIFFIKQSKSITKSIVYGTLLGLVFSVLGDILLMFVNKSAHFFTLGLISFLLAHIMYVIVFLKHRNPTKKPYGFIAFLLIYAAGLFYLLRNGLGDLLIPVIVYMLVILTMATTAFIRKGKVNTNSYYFALTGAIFFMISDSILALNKFYQPLPLSNISIMLTYALAQYFIVLGVLRLR